jgi:hypothetical protein
MSKILIDVIMTKEPQAANCYTPDFDTLWLRLQYGKGVLIDVMHKESTDQYQMTVLHVAPATDKGPAPHPVLKSRFMISKADGEAIFEKYHSKEEQEGACDHTALMITGGKNKKIIQA